MMATMRRFVLAVLTAALLAGCGQGYVAVDGGSLTPTPAPVPYPTASATSASRPLAAVTPGTVLTTREADVCTRGWATAHRQSLTAAQKRAVLAAYHLPATIKIAEWDHLVSLELGGGNGTTNIWPDRSVADQARKDRLENDLHREVCAGRMTLITAQTRIRSYWLYWRY